MLCNGNHSEFCGGSSRLDVYDYNNSVSLPPWTTTSTATASGISSGLPSSVGTSTSSTSSIISSPISSSGSSAVQSLAIKPTVGVYSFQGCYTEATDGRALSLASFYDYTAMTLEECAGDCAAYDYFGVEYGGECWSTPPFLVLRSLLTE
jgi:hypothetical protein